MALLMRNHLLEEAGEVAARSQLVAINKPAVQDIARRLVRDDMALSPWDRDRHFFDGTYRTVHYLLVLHALSFCLWSPDWTVEYKGRTCSGYWALVVSLRRAFGDGVAIWNAKGLSRMSEVELGYLLRGNGQVPHLEERVAVLRELGSILQGRYAGDFTTGIKEAGGNALGLVEQIVEAFPFFRDEGIYQRRTVRFQQAAQSFVASLHWAFSAARWGRFKDLHGLTAPADHRLPQVLRGLDVLRYSTELARVVDGCTPLPVGSPAEIEIRAGAVWAVELLRREMESLGHSALPVALGRYLSGLAGRLPNLRPHHLCATTSY
jgi:hypothetical protein